MEIKSFFSETLLGLQEKMNEFLDENPNVQIISANIANEGSNGGGNHFVIYIVCNYIHYI